jgi:hypothetical protein
MPLEDEEDGLVGAREADEVLAGHELGVVDLALLLGRERRALGRVLGDVHAVRVVQLLPPRAIPPFSLSIVIRWIMVMVVEVEMGRTLKKPESCSTTRTRREDVMSSSTFTGAIVFALPDARFVS